MSAKLSEFIVQLSQLLLKSRHFGAWQLLVRITTAYFLCLCNPTFLFQFTEEIVGLGSKNFICDDFGAL